MTAPNTYQPPPPIVLSKADAKSPALYRAAKAQAEAEGRALIIAPEAPAAPQRPAENTIVVRPGTSSQDYQRLKAQSEQSGKPLAFVDANGNLA